MPVPTQGLGLFFIAWIILRTIGFWYPFVTILPEAVCVLGMLVSMFGMGRQYGVDATTEAVEKSLSALTNGIIAGVDLKECFTSSCDDCDVVDCERR